jgi:hypothetical protein
MRMLGGAKRNPLDEWYLGIRVRFSVICVTSGKISFQGRIRVDKPRCQDLNQLISFQQELTRPVVAVRLDMNGRIHSYLGATQRPASAAAR